MDFTSAKPLNQQRTRRKDPNRITVTIMFSFAAVMLLLPSALEAHCDTLEGPVVIAAKKALETEDITPVLKWIKKDNETDVRTAFQKTLAVRGMAPEAQELADHYFFETLVRIHRASEGAPYTGLSAGPVEPIIAAADQALEKGSVDHVVKHVTEAVAAGIRKRFADTAEKKKHADEGVAAGREFVEAYVDFTHYVERLHLDAKGAAEHGHSPAAVDKYVDPCCRALLPGNQGDVDVGEFRSFVGMLYTAFPDLGHTITDQFVERDTVVTVVTVRGTHTGSFLGISPTQKGVVFTDILITRFRGGKIVELRGQFDALGVLRQLGKFPIEN